MFHLRIVAPESSMMTLISKSNYPSGTRCAPHLLATAALFQLLPVSPVLGKVLIESTMKADTLSPTQRGHRDQAMVTHLMDMVPSIPAIHLLPKSTAAVETLPPHFLGKIRTGQDSPSARIEVLVCPVLGIIPCRKCRPGGEASMICPLSRITPTGLTLSPSPSMMLHHWHLYTPGGSHQKFLVRMYSRGQDHRS